jgi:hypothetical protein
VPRQFPIRASDNHFLIPALVSNGRELVLIRDFDDGGCLELQLKGHAMLSSLAAKYNAFAPPPAQVFPTVHPARLPPRDRVRLCLSFLSRSRTLTINQ